MSSATDRPARSPILWGAYLACSWTWCIGMFLPALLMRDMGWAGFLIFAIPNITGAAAMGWIFKSRLDSVHFVENHATAIWWFSSITIAFHLFWILWIARFIQYAFQLPRIYFIGSLLMALLFAFFMNRAVQRDKTPQIAAALLLFSLGILIATFCTSDVQEATATLVNTTPPSLEPLWMLPVMGFGFLLCPYLDATFHHARQQLDTAKNGRLGFAIGFVGFFACMILLTTRYAGAIEDALNGSCNASIATPWLAAGIWIHLLCQWLFTVHVHLDRLRTLPKNRFKQPALLSLILVAGLIGFFANHLPAYAGITGGELIYRLFMSAYGLLFPTYMLYRVVMARKENSPVSLRTLWLAAALAAPLFWMGFIERQTIWLIPGMMVVFLGALLKKNRAENPR